jgi:hypothetical protein
MQIFSFCMAVLNVVFLLILTVIYGAPEEIRTPDPQIRSLSVALNLSNHFPAPPLSPVRSAFPRKDLAGSDRHAPRPKKSSTAFYNNTCHKQVSGNDFLLAAREPAQRCAEVPSVELNDQLGGASTGEFLVSNRHQSAIL